MKKIRFCLLAGCALLLAASTLEAQTSVQRLTFSLAGEYQTNTFYTNAALSTGSWTSEYAFVRPILITTANVVRALAVDVDGTNYTKWNGAAVVREVNLTNGNEAIFLRKGPMQTNVSSYFEGSYSNNFMSGIANAFPAYSNNIAGLTNDINGLTNGPIPQTLVYHGWLRKNDPSNPTNVTTNYISTGGLYYLSMNTTNIKFNLVAVGNGSVTNVVGSVDGVRYEKIIDSEFVGVAGAYYLNVSTNLYNLGDNPPVYVTGPMHGTFSTGAPAFSTMEGP